MTTAKSIANALTIAGSDSGGGAGIQADLKAFSALGAYGASVITALTAQNTVTVSAIHPVPTDFISAQIDAVCSDIQIDAVKIGMLGTPEITHTVAEGIRRHSLNNIILDPVMVAKSGDALLQEDAIDALKSELVPLAQLITPNLPEAGVLLGRAEPDSVDAMQQAAEDLHKLGADNVLVKGGHLDGDVNTDVLFDGKGFYQFSHPRIDTTNTHGTGCTLSSAITALVAQGVGIPEATATAADYIHTAIAGADKLNVGEGHGPVHHFHALWSQL